MLLNSVSSSLAEQQPSAAMIRISAGLRYVNVRAVVNSLLVKQSPSSSSSSSSLSAADYYSSAVALRERKDNSSFTDRHRNPTYASPSASPHLTRLHCTYVTWVEEHLTVHEPGSVCLPISFSKLVHEDISGSIRRLAVIYSRDVSAGGGARPKTPRVWRTKSKRGSVAKSEKLVDLVNKLSNTKEEVYGALDAWIAWDLEFPLIAVKKALKTLKDLEDWRRIIQVSKWMLEKGQGKTLATYQLLLQAFDHEGRIEEAEDLWEKVMRDNQECIPRTMFAQMIAMYDRYGKKKELLKVFADMEELQVKPDPGTVEKVVRAYSHYGYHEVAQALREREAAAIAEYQFIGGKRVKINTRPFGDKANGSGGKERLVETSIKSPRTLGTVVRSKTKETVKLDASYEQEERTRWGFSDGPQEKRRLESNIELEEGPRLVTSNTLEKRPNLETRNELEKRPTFKTEALPERPRLEAENEGKEIPTLERTQMK